MSLRDDLQQDLAEIFEAEEVSTTALVSPASGAPNWELTGMFRSPYRADALGAIEVGGQGYSFLCGTADAAAGGLEQGDTLTIDGADYRHVEPQDGNPTAGMSTLQLAPL